MKKIEIYAKHSDLISYIITEDDKIIRDKEESPYPLSICTSYDDMCIEIDMETGMILNWDKNKALELLQQSDEDEDEDEDGDGDDMSVAQKKWDDSSEKRQQKIMEDAAYYSLELEKIKEELLKYQEEFGNVVLDEQTESVYKMHDANKYDCIQFCMYRLFVVSIELMKNNVKCVFDKSSKMLKVNSIESDKARELLKNIGAYDFNFCRRDDDIYNMLNNII